MSKVALVALGLSLFDPTAQHTSLNVEATYTTWEGQLGNEESTSILLQGNYVLGDSWMIEASLPMNGDQPIWQPERWKDYSHYRIRQIEDIKEDSGRMVKGHDHFYDFQLGLMYKGKIGLSVVLPTSEDGTAARGQVLVGPKFAYAKHTDNALYGFEFTHLIDVHGDKDISTNESYLNLVLVRKLSENWAIQSAPEILIDWNGVSGNRLSLPLNLGIYRLKDTYTVGFELNYFIARPDRFSREWQTGLTFSKAWK